ncbi:hypothetical protein SAMN05216480_10884 [Pustulibacterium marinum]|uniref:Uncharacterized protein n=1 Tax=Pustulibacterium marinum TaxID=1224947 RepID=A0A1I7HBH5_9FLAO|nr:hypothetical protein SAMN05216480_10884 [Pustulibacterium marinum]
MSQKINFKNLVVLSFSIVTLSFGMYNLIETVISL